MIFYELCYDNNYLYAKYFVTNIKSFLHITFKHRLCGNFVAD